MKSKASASSPAKAATSVDAFMLTLKHPLKADIEAARRIILGVSPQIGEAIKWNAPSFCTTEFFATTNLRSTKALQFIFHRGAKVRTDHAAMKIPDPAGLVKWLAKDRCTVTVGAGKDIAANRAALEDIVREWIKYV